MTKNVNDLFEEYYDNHNLDESRYSHFSKKQLVIEAEYMQDALQNILKYLDDGGTDLNAIRGEVMDGIYESRIWKNRILGNKKQIGITPICFFIVLEI